MKILLVILFGVFVQGCGIIIRDVWDDDKPSLIEYLIPDFIWEHTEDGEYKEAGE